MLFRCGKDEETGKNGRKREGGNTEKKIEKDTRRSAFARGVACRYKTEMDRVKYVGKRQNTYAGIKTHKHVKGTRLQRDGEERHDEMMGERVRCMRVREREERRRKEKRKSEARFNNSALKEP